MPVAGGWASSSDAVEFRKLARDLPVCPLTDVICGPVSLPITRKDRRTEVFAYSILSLALTIPQQDDRGVIGGVFGVLGGCCAVAFLIVAVTGFWMTFTKADEHGWASIIPFYNIWVLLRIVGRPGWWLILFFIPFVNIIVGLIVMIDLAKSFDQSTLFGVGLFILPIIFALILGFGASQYYGPAAGK
jgi:hypothetical protein